MDTTALPKLQFPGTYRASGHIRPAAGGPVRILDFSSPYPGVITKQCLTFVAGNPDVASGRLLVTSQTVDSAMTVVGGWTKETVQNAWIWKDGE